MSEVSDRLFAAISKAKYSYGDLSRLTGIPKSAIQRYATGETEKIPLDRLEALASALDVSSSWLMGWSESPDLVSLARQAAEHQRLIELWDRADEIDRNTIWSILSRYDEKGAGSSASAG